VNRNLYLPVFLLWVAAVPAAGDVAREDLVAEILKQVPDWPRAQVEMPLSVYEQLIRDIVAGPVLPKPPEATWIERVAWTVEVGESEAAVAPVFDVVSLPGVPPQPVRLLPAAIVWRDAAVDGRKIDLRRDKDGWFYFDPPEAGRYRVAAKASIKPSPSAEGLRVGFQTPKAALAAVAVESKEAWEVRFKGSPLAIVGDEKGTRGTVGLAPETSLEVTWRRPQPPVHREAQVEAQSEIGWTLGEGTHQVRAILNLRLWGGETSELTVNLPPGADRVSIAGPDVREVQVQGAAARVFLRGAITQRTRLAVSFESPRPATGRMTLPMFGVAGAAQRGGTLAIAGGAGGVLLELDPAGMAPVALADLPDETRALLSAPAMYGYTLTGGAWEARVDLVGMSEFPVRETLADSALYTVLYRPDGHVMVKVIYEVRNRGQQYMRVDLPEGAQLIVARVAEQHKPLARGPDHGVYVPLEKSVLTTAGLISFPVEIVYVMRGPGLARQGKFRLPLVRIDLPVAYARCALMLPDGLKAGEWQGTLRRVPVWSGETANLEFEYGTGHLAKLPPKAVKVPRLGRTPGLGALFSDLSRVGVPATEGEPDVNGPADLPNTVLQAKNLYRGGVDYYQRGNYEKAGEMFRQVMTVAPKSLEADNASKYLGNIDIAHGKDSSGAGGDRSLRATAKAVQLSQQAGNVEVIEKQQQALERAEEALQKGDESKAEAAYKVAVNLAGQLAGRGEVAREQEATVRKAREFLGKQELGRQEESKKLADLQQQIASLKGSIAEKGGKEMAQVVEALTGDGTTKLQDGGAGQVLISAHPSTNALVLRASPEDYEKIGKLITAIGSQRAGQQGQAAQPPAPTAGGTLALGAQGTGQTSRSYPAVGGTPPVAPEHLAGVRVTPGELAPWRGATGFIPPGAYGGLEGRAPAAKPTEPQVEMNEALAEQQFKLGGKLATKYGRAPDYQLGGGGAGGGTTARPHLTGGGTLSFGSGRIVELQKQVEELKTLHDELLPKGVDGKVQVPAIGIASANIDLPQLDASDFQAVVKDGKTGADVTVWRSKDKLTPEITVTPSAGLERKVQEKARSLSAKATEAAELARQGRVVEADQMIRSMERDVEVASRVAHLIRKQGDGNLERADAAIPAVPAPEREPAKQARRPVVEIADGARVADKAARGTVPSLDLRLQPDALDRQAKLAQLWDQASQLRGAMKYGEAIEILDRLIAVDPNHERAQRWREDLLYLDAQARQGGVRSARERTTVDTLTDTEQAAIRPGALVEGRTRYLRYPDAKDWKEPTQFRREFTTAVSSEPKAVAETRRRLAEDIELDLEKTSLVDALKQIGERPTRLNIVIDPDIAAGGMDLSTRVVSLKVKGVSIEAVLGLILGADLGYKVESGYILVTTKEKLRREAAAAAPSAPATGEWKDLGEARQKLEKARQIVIEKSKELDKVQIDVRDLTVDLDGDKKLAAFVANNYAWALQPKAGQGQAVVRGEANFRSGIALDVGGGVLGVSVGEGHYDNSVTVSNGTLVLANDPGAINQVQRVLDRLRVNVGQRVPVGSRNVLVPAETAVNAGIQWKSGANGVSYAMANEGQLLALLDLEQRAANTGVAAGTNEVRLDAVVGTSALVANGGVVEIARAADKANTLAYNGNTLEVPLDDYLVINNGRYLTAVKTGRMQHWSAEAEPVRFPGVPAAVVVPAVGYTVKFEKTLLDTSDTLELVTDYTWEGEKR
jgi:tetratricopeptide (TPR) repeat protein